MRQTTKRKKKRLIGAISSFLSIPPVRYLGCVKCCHLFPICIYCEGEIDERQHNSGCMNESNSKGHSNYCRWLEMFELVNK